MWRIKDRAKLISFISSMLIHLLILSISFIIVSKDLHFKYKKREFYLSEIKIIEISEKVIKQPPKLEPEKETDRIPQDTNNIKKRQLVLKNFQNTGLKQSPVLQVERKPQPDEEMMATEIEVSKTNEKAAKGEEGKVVLPPRESIHTEVINYDENNEQELERKKTYTRMFGKENAPKFNKSIQPKYPELAKKLGKEGEVILLLTIDEKGKLLNVEVIKKGGYGFDKAAVRAIKRSTFFPATRGERPIKSKASLPIRFILNK